MVDENEGVHRMLERTRSRVRGVGFGVAQVGHRRYAGKDDGSGCDGDGSGDELCVIFYGFACVRQLVVVVFMVRRGERSERTEKRRKTLMPRV